MYFLDFYMNLEKRRKKKKREAGKLVCTNRREAVALPTILAATSD
jgi:hypothetical protein